MERILGMSKYYPDGYTPQEYHLDEIWEEACIRFKTDEPTSEQLEEVYQEKLDQNAYF